MRTKGKYFWKKEWYSICSLHMEYQENCPLCNKGQWINVTRHWFNKLLYKYCYSLWFYNMNGRFPPKGYKKSLNI